MAVKHSKNLFDQLSEALTKIDDLTDTIKSLVDELKTVNDKNSQQQLLIEKLLLEIERLKTNNKKDSSNSNKPSGTNGFKKAITNRREKSNKKQGGQLNHELHRLDEDKVSELISKGAKVDIIDINLNEANKNTEYKTIKVIDIDVVTKIIEYRYYPDE